MTSPIINDFIERAKTITVSEAAGRIGLRAPDRGEYQGPCPRCGGKDRFSVNLSKNVFNCRSCGGGRDGIGLAAHWRGYNLRTRAEFLLACADALGEVVPAEGEQETDEERAAREQRTAEFRAKAQADNARREEKVEKERQKAINLGRGLWLNALDCMAAGQRPAEGYALVRRYLRFRTGFWPHDGVFDHIRYLPRATYYHGEDEFRRPVSLYVGPALSVPFVNLEGRITGSQQIWIDLTNKPKFRPMLIDAEGKPLSSKKMHGAKRGSFLPVFGSPDADRWVVGEGIENPAAWAGPEGWRDDTFYLAAGDIGNLAGPRDPASDFVHPTLKTLDKLGRARSVKVQGPVPKPDQAPDDAMQVPAHVKTLLVLADGDSEPVQTAACLARMAARLERPGLDIQIVYPPEGTDFSDAFADGVRHWALSGRELPAFLECDEND
ncbi:hypothetical protein [Allorhizobium taibaishanense]|uniref:Zinc finger CHC2-type domain-containing protein n=1 Tax=Allorhizobium taibaishanense TaxID=887144 RepID=A0A1Q9A2T0_9HYPH|nr:hypothetical protein [Allorhizobium taibaishanense]MBB4005820.1 hypothetical protein [Allorhizobium taibaishanense]OLP48869.1 hypothetical protein BJF91_17185 [Allorhizobium taibaishanense]